MAKQALDLTAIQINETELHQKRELNPDYDGYSLAKWVQQGIVAKGWLEIIEPGEWPVGLFQPHAFVLTCTYSRISEKGSMGSRQEALGDEMIDQLRLRLVDVMRANGWSTPYKTKAGRDIWVWYREGDPRRVIQAPEPATKAGASVLNEHDLPEMIIAGAGAAVPGEAKLNVTIDDLQPGALRYAAHWIESGIQITLRLEARDDDQAQGYLLETWYVGRHASMRPLGQKQQALAAQREFQLCHRFQIALEDAGWIVKQKEDGEVWYHSSQVSTAKQSGEAQTDLPKLEPVEPEKPRSHVVEVIGGSEAKERGQQPAYSREVFTREVTFTCIVCGDTVTQQRFPGHLPLYCSPGCQEMRKREKTRERVARHRELKKQ